MILHTAKAKPRICTIGAGISGLCLAVKLKTELKFESFVIYEVGNNVGGTWLVNTYPGCSCDIPSYLYCFSFAPKYDWSHFYASQSEILEYLKLVADKFNIIPHIRFQSQVQSISWNEEKSQWDTVIFDNKNQKRLQMEFDIVINGTGQLRQPNYPAEYLSFKGELLHSAKWNHSITLTRKRVGIIGTGASAVQIISSIAPEVKHLVIFQRTAPYVLPRIELKIPNYVKTALYIIPGLYRLVRASLFYLQEFLHGATQYKSRLQRQGVRFASRYRKAEISDPVLLEKLKPGYAITHKRVILSKFYYATLRKSNVTLVTDEIKQLKGHCIKTVNEKSYELDVLILATGFKPQEYFAPMQIYGRQGVDILFEWKKNKPSTYLGIMSWNTPNLFTIMGPYTQVGHNSNIISIESQANWILNSIKMMTEMHTSVISINKHVENDFMKFVEESFRDTVWANDSCKTWYINENGENRMLWPRNLSDYCKLCNFIDCSLFDFC